MAVDAPLSRLQRTQITNRYPAPVALNPGRNPSITAAGRLQAHHAGSEAELAAR